MDPLLFPWGGISHRSTHWNGKGFTKAREDNKPALRALRAPARVSHRTAPAAPVAAALPPSHGRRAAGPSATRSIAVTGTSARNEKPRFDLAVDLAEDGHNERMLLEGRDLVVFGKAFKGGAGYAFLTLEQFADPRDIVGVDARDITDDGKAEIFVRGVIHAARPERGRESKPGAVVDREVMLVYAVTPRGITRTFGVETGRTLGGKRVQGALALLPRRARLRYRGATRACLRLHRKDVSLRPRPSESRRPRASLAPLGADGRGPLPLGRRVVHQIAARVTESALARGAPEAREAAR